jgi:hypothetical protein
MYVKPLISAMGHLQALQSLQEKTGGTSVGEKERQTASVDRGRGRRVDVFGQWRLGHR